MKRKIVSVLLSVCVTAAITTPVLAATEERTYISSSPSSEDGYSSTTKSVDRGSSSTSSSSSSSSNTNSDDGSIEVSEEDKQGLIDTLTGVFSGSDSNTQAADQRVCYVKNRRYYGTWAGRSLSISNGISNFGDNVYAANSWKRNSITASGSAYRSPEWDRQIGHDPYWSGDIYNYPYYNSNPYRYPYYNNNSDSDNDKDDDNSSSSTPSAPNVITYSQAYGNSGSNGTTTRGDVLANLQKSYAGSNTSTTSTSGSEGTSVSGKTANINQSVADKTEKEQKEAEEKAREGGVTGGVARSDYAYVNILGAVTPDDYDTLDENLKKVISADPELVNTFKKNSWKIVLTTADLNELLFNNETQGVMGCTVNDKKAIYIHAGEHAYCVIHEFGHFLDFMAGETSNSTAYKQIFDEEGSKLSTYGGTSADEFFAETYYFFITDPTYLKNNAPKSYAYMLDIKKSVTGI